VELVDRTCGPDPCTPVPQEILSAPRFVDLALGPDFSCGLAEDGTAWCWGRNDRGQLGDGTRIDRWEPMPVSGGHVFGSLRAGWQHACGVDDAGRLLCWGSDRTGFGNGGEGPDAAIEVDVPEVGASGLLFASTVVDVSIQCGLDATGGAWCWGANGTAQLGNGTAQRVGRVTTPTRVIRHPTR
jgi:alpha-tubulin suppressor-like RCC1 family protein